MSCYDNPLDRQERVTILLARADDDSVAEAARIMNEAEEANPENYPGLESPDRMKRGWDGTEDAEGNDTREDAPAEVVGQSAPDGLQEQGAGPTQAIPAEAAGPRFGGDR